MKGGTTAMNRYMRRHGQGKGLQAGLAKLQEELAKATVEGVAGGGAVKVVMNGQMQVQSVQIAPEAVDPQDVEMLQDLIVAALNDAVAKAQGIAASSLGGALGGLKLQ